MKIDTACPPSALLRHLLVTGCRVRPAGLLVMVGPANKIPPELRRVIQHKRHALRALAAFRPPLTVEELSQ